MENPRKIWRKFVEYSSSFWCPYPFGLCVLILNWGNARKYVLGKDWHCSRKNRFQFWSINWFGFGKTGSVFEENLSPILGKSVTDFGAICHRLWGKLSPTLRKSVTDFEKTCHGLWENLPPILVKSVSVTKSIAAWKLCKDNRPELLETEERYCFVFQNIFVSWHLSFWAAIGPSNPLTASVARLQGGASSFLCRWNRGRVVFQGSRNLKLLKSFEIFAFAETSSHLRHFVYVTTAWHAGGISKHTALMGPKWMSAHCTTEALSTAEHFWSIISWSGLGFRVLGFRVHDSLETRYIPRGANNHQSVWFYSHRIPFH